MEKTDLHKGMRKKSRSSQMRKERVGEGDPAVRDLTKVECSRGTRWELFLEMFLIAQVVVFGVGPSGHHVQERPSEKIEG